MIKKLDKKGRKLLFELDFDARAPYSVLAKRVGLSKQSVEYRIKNLVKEGIIKRFYPIIDGTKLGYHYCKMGLVLHNTTKKRREELMTYLREGKAFFWVFTAQGSFDVRMGAWFISLHDFKDAMEKLLQEFGDVIKAHSVSIALQVDCLRLRGIFPEGKKDVRSLCIRGEQKKITAVDKKILKILSIDARTSLVDLAKEVGASTKTIAARIKRMEREKIILGYRPSIDFRALGLAYYKLWMTVTRKKGITVDKIYSYLLEDPRVNYLIKSIGVGPDVEVDLFIKSNEELYAFVQDLRDRFPGAIGPYKTTIFLSEEKVEFTPF